jgi:hypothetical protein
MADRAGRSDRARERLADEKAAAAAPSPVAG